MMSLQGNAVLEKKVGAAGIKHLNFAALRGF